MFLRFTTLALDVSDGFGRNRSMFLKVVFLIKKKHAHVFLFIRKRFIRKWGYRGQTFKKVEVYNAPALRKFKIQKILDFNHSNRS